MTILLSPHLRSVFQALLVTFLWSTSWVLIKIGLTDLPPLTFAGLRYTLAFFCLLPFAVRRSRRDGLKNLTTRQWLQLAFLGVLFYTVTQGAQFFGLDYLPATAVSLLLNFSIVVVALLGIPLLGERPRLVQWLGIGLSASGGLLYFYPVSFSSSQWLGFLVVAAGVLANALSSVLGRHLNRGMFLPPLLITTTSMGFGGLLLLASGLFLQGLPRLAAGHYALIAWLAVVNTAFAFTLWNHTLRTLSAVESSIINNTMLVQIAVLAWVFLGERLTLQQLAGMGLAALGALVVQLRRSSR